jgi:hypothetical protein
VLCVAGCIAAIGSQALTQTATTTTLTITSGGSAVSTVPMGTVVTLTATVTVGATAPVSPGQVKFCDATAAHCEDIHVVGFAQLTSTGIAMVKFRPGVGSHSYNAVFLGTPNGSPAYAGSASGNGSLTVSPPGLYPSTTTLTVSGSPGSYTLGSTVSGIGSAPPTGTVSFIDTSDGNATLGTASLTNASSSFGLTNVSNPATGADPNAIAVADFNGDGIPDIAVINVGDAPSGGTLTILLGKGDGTFATAPSPATSLFASDVVAGDFNGDGIPDLAVASLVGAPTILLGNGDGTFTAAVTPPVVNEISALAVGDFNGDGNLDLALLSDSAGSVGTDAVTILLGHGDGTFTLGATVSGVQFENPTSLAVADFNGDGKLDIAIGNGTEPVTCIPSCPPNQYLTISLGKGDGTFTSSTISSDSQPFVQIDSVAAADLNGDGVPDLAVVTADSVAVLLGNGDGTFGAPAAGPAIPGRGGSMAVGDFNGDGIADLAVTYERNSSQDYGVLTLLGKGDGTFTSQTFEAAANSLNPEGYLSGIAVADFNGDGLGDVAAPDSTNNTAMVLLSQAQFDVAAPLTPIMLNSAGVHLIEATYPGDADYTASTSAITEFNLYGAPTISLALSAMVITYGSPETLTGTVTGSGPAPTGTVSFYNGASIVAGNVPLVNGVAMATLPDLPAQSDTISYRFFAAYSGDVNYPAVTSSSVAPVVRQASPTIVWPVPATMPYGTALPAATVQGNVQGTFSYNPALTSPLNVGKQTVITEFTPSDTNDYTSASDTLTVTVTQGTPAVALATASGASQFAYSMPVTLNVLVTVGVGTCTGAVAFNDGGTLLGSAALGPVNFGPNSAASFTTSALSVGQHSITAVYSGDSNCVSVTSGVVPLNVTGGLTPTITWSTPAAITYGTPLGATQLNATASVAGSFVYTPAAGTVLGAGTKTLSVTFTPTDATDYATATSTVLLTVLQATPTINWSTPAAITYGTALSATQLNATSTVTGSFAYSPAPGIVLAAGSQTLSVTFAPTDTTDYTTATSTAVLTVNKATPTIALATSASSAYVLNPVIFTATVASPAGTPSGTVAFYDGMALLGTESMTSGVATYQTSALLAGTHSITAVYSGDTNFLAATSSALSQVIENFTIGASGGTSSVTASPGGQAVYTFTVTPPSGTTFAGPITFSVTGLPAGASATFSPMTVAAGAGATTVTMTVTLAASAAVRTADRPFSGGALPLVALGLVLLPFAGRVRRAARGLKGMVCLLVLGAASVALVSGLSGCGGSGSNNPPPENYTLTVTASAGSLSNTFAVGLVVE